MKIFDRFAIAGQPVRVVQQPRNSLNLLTALRKRTKAVFRALTFPVLILSQSVTLKAFVANNSPLARYLQDERKDGVGSIM